MSLADTTKAISDGAKTRIPPETLAIMEAATAKLAASGMAARALKTGDRMPDFTLPDANGTLISSEALRRKGSLLITFYRGNWCPYCNVELKALQDRLPQITAAGASLVAISPQTPDHSLTAQQKNELAYPVLSDVGNRVARDFGLVFALEAPLRNVYDNFGIDLLAHNGDKSYELPVPATYLVGADGIVRQAFVDVDYRNRLDPDEALRWLQG